jgi:hypothetical protein
MGFTKEVIKPGSGPKPEKGQTVTVNITAQRDRGSVFHLCRFIALELFKLRERNSGVCDAPTDNACSALDLRYAHCIHSL